MPPRVRLHTQTNRKKEHVINILKDKGYLLIGEAIPSENVFIKAAEVEKRSYSERLVRRIYDHIFSGMINLRQEYQKYYAKEYSNILSFLYWKYDIDEDILKANEKRILASKFIGFASSANDGDHNLSFLLESEVGHELLHSLFKRATKKVKAP